MKLVHWPGCGGGLDGWAVTYSRAQSFEGTGRGPTLPRPLLAVPNVTAHPSAASAPITVLLYNGPLLCGFNADIKGLKLRVPYVVACVKCRSRMMWRWLEVSPMWWHLVTVGTDWWAGSRRQSVEHVVHRNLDATPASSVVMQRAPAVGAVRVIRHSLTSLSLSNTLYRHYYPPWEPATLCFWSPVFVPVYNFANYLRQRRRYYVFARVGLSVCL